MFFLFRLFARPRLLTTQDGGQLAEVVAHLVSDFSYRPAEIRCLGVRNRTRDRFHLSAELIGSVCVKGRPTGLVYKGTAVIQLCM